MVAQTNHPETPSTLKNAFARVYLVYFFINHGARCLLAFLVREANAVVRASETGHAQPECI